MQVWSRVGPLVRWLALGKTTRYVSRPQGYLENHGHDGARGTWILRAAWTWTCCVTTDLLQGEQEREKGSPGPSELASQHAISRGYFV